MEWSIGEIRQIDDEWYQCVESYFSCEGCDFKNTSKCSHEGVECSFPVRQDYISVIFKKLEKIGGPYNDCGTILQRFKIYTNVTNANTKGLELHIYSNDTIGIEVKQDKKEDMGENKTPLPKENNHLTRAVYAYVNGKISDNELIKSIKEMPDEYPYDKNNIKPFSLEAAKAGKPVCTRDGRKARIICFDLSEEYPIAARVYDNVENKILLFSYKEDGRINNYDYKSDLMMLTEKRSGWVNLYRKNNDLITSKDVFCSNKAAIECVDDENDEKYYIATAKISWEE